MEGRRAAPRLRPVDDIVVDQNEIVRQFERRGAAIETGNGPVGKSGIGDDEQG